MKIVLIKPIVVSIALVLTSNAIAASQKNHIQPPPDMAAQPVQGSRCTVSAGSANIDYGSLTRGQMQNLSGRGSSLTPGLRSLPITVSCPYSRVMTLTINGDRAANGSLRYGEYGSIRMHLKNAQVDGHSVLLAYTTANGEIIGATVSSQELLPGKSVSAIVNGRPIQGYSLTAELEILPILPERASRVWERTLNEARLTLEIQE